MHESSSKARQALARRNVELLQRVNNRMQAMARILESLAQFSQPMAEQAQARVDRAIDALLQDLQQELADAVSRVLEEKEASQEDWDSSLEFHLMHQLKRQVEEL